MAILKKIEIHDVNPWRVDLDTILHDDSKYVLFYNVNGDKFRYGFKKLSRNQYENLINEYTYGLKRNCRKDFIDIHVWIMNRAIHFIQECIEPLIEDLNNDLFNNSEKVMREKRRKVGWRIYYLFRDNLPDYLSNIEK